MVQAWPVCIGVIIGLMSVDADWPDWPAELTVTDRWSYGRAHGFSVELGTERTGIYTPQSHRRDTNEWLLTKM